MADADRNVELIHGLYERYALGEDVDYLFDHLADDVVWRSIGPSDRLRFARPCQGPDEVREFFAALAEDWEMISFKVNELIGQGDRVVVLSDVCFCHRQTGKLVATPKADVLRVLDGKIAEFREFYDSAAVVEAATDSGDTSWHESALTGDLAP
jgi:ketosteroid isomerase-like protein